MNTFFNECLNFQDNDCSLDADCINTLGSYVCQCKVGFKDISKEQKGNECELIGIIKSEEKKWMIIICIIGGLLLVGLPITGVIIRKKYLERTKVVPIPAKKVTDLKIQT